MNTNTSPIVVYEGKYQRMVVRGHWEYSERVHEGGLATVIVAVTPDDKMVLVEQFRIPLQAKTIEMPAGLVADTDHGESIESSAIRELEEETGWLAQHAEVIMIGPTSPGASNEQIALVRATHLTKVGNGGGIDDENIIVHEIPKQSVALWLMQKMQQGYLVDCKLWSGLWFLDHHLDGSPYVEK